MTDVHMGARAESGGSELTARPDKLLYTPGEAAALLSIGRTKLFELLADGTLPSVRIGNCRRVPAAALESLVRELLAASEGP